MKHFFDILLFSLVAFASCSQPIDSCYAPDRLVEISSLPPTDTLKGQLIISSLSELDVYEIDCVGPMLVAQTINPKGMFGICYLSDPENLVFVGDIGHAANEFGEHPGISNAEAVSDSLLLLYGKDRITLRLTALDVLSSFREKKCVLHQTYSLSENRFEVPIFKSDKRIASFYERSYGDVRNYEFYPPRTTINGFFGEKEINTFPRLINTKNLQAIDYAYYIQLKISPNRKKIVQNMRFLDIINVLDVDKGEVLGMVRKDRYGFDFFEKNESYEYYIENTVLYSRTMSVSNDKIFLLRDERLIKQYKEDETRSILPTLEIFSIAGDFLGSFVLDKPLWNTSYSEYYNCLIAIDFDMNIYRYELPKLEK